MIGVLQRGDLLRARADTKPPALCRLPAPYEADIWLGFNFNLFFWGPWVARGCPAMGWKYLQQPSIYKTQPDRLLPFLVVVRYVLAPS
jgi:hypothetical protein